MAGTSYSELLAGDLGKLDQMMKDMTTKDYYEYKGDAMNVDMDVDGSLTQKNLKRNGKVNLIPAKPVLVQVF